MWFLGNIFFVSFVIFLVVVRICRGRMIKTSEKVRESLRENKNVSQEKRFIQVRAFNDEIKKFKKRIAYCCILVFVGCFLLLCGIGNITDDIAYPIDGVYKVIPNYYIGDFHFY